MAFLDKGTLWGIKKETSYGNSETLDYAVDIVELIDPSMDGTIDEIERETTRNSLVMAESLLGKETSSGTLTVEVTSTDSNGDLNGDILYESAMGVKIEPVANLVLATPSSVGSTISVDTGAGDKYQVGQGLKVKVDSSYVYVTVTGISGDDLSVAPTITGTSVTEVEGLLSYRLAVPKTPAVSFNIEEYLESDTQALVYKYLGCVAASMSIEFPLANIIKSSFSVNGAGFNAGASAAKTGTCFDLIPHIAKNIVFLYGGTSYDISELTLNVENEIYDSESLTSSGIKSKLVTGKPTVGGSFVVDLEDLSLFNNYKAKTHGELIIETTASNGKKFGGYAPKVSIKNESKSKDSSVYKDNVELQILSSDACVAGVEDALSIWFE